MTAGRDAADAGIPEAQRRIPELDGLCGTAILAVVVFRLFGSRASRQREVSLRISSILCSWEAGQ